MATALSVLAGQDGPDRRALPVGEFFHPAPLAALALLAANDWWLKGAGLLPAAVTGKLSDFAGVVFFPLLVTALVGVGRLGARRLGQNIDPSLSVARLAVAVWATGLLMPRIEARHIDAIIDGFEPAADRDVCAPTYSGRRGNPVLWSASYFAELQTLRGDRGARTLLERYSDRVRLIELDASVTFDVDVPDDLP